MVEIRYKRVTIDSKKVLYFYYQFQKGSLRLGSILINVSEVFEIGRWFDNDSRCSLEIGCWFDNDSRCSLEIGRWFDNDSRCPL